MEITFDYYARTQKLLEVFEYRETLGINFDPSHLIWREWTRPCSSMILPPGYIMYISRMRP